MRGIYVHLGDEGQGAVEWLKLQELSMIPGKRKEMSRLSSKPQISLRGNFSVGKCYI